MGSFSIHNCRAISNHQRGGVQDYQHAGQVVQVCLRCWKRGLHSHSPHCDGPVCPQPSPNISTLALRIEELWRQKDTRRHVLPSGHQDTRASCICHQSLEATSDVRHWLPRTAVLRHSSAPRWELQLGRNHSQNLFLHQGTFQLYQASRK